MTLLLSVMIISKCPGVTVRAACCALLLMTQCDSNVNEADKQSTLCAVTLANKHGNHLNVRLQNKRVDVSV